jgi:hypothetical protein
MGIPDGSRGRQQATEVDHRFAAASGQAFGVFVVWLAPSRMRSSARFYESDGSFVDRLLPRTTPPPAEFWAGG